MNPIFEEEMCQRQRERRDMDVAHLAIADAERRGYADRRIDEHWRHNWLRTRIRQSLRD